MRTLAVSNNGVLPHFNNNDTLKILAMRSLKTHGKRRIGAGLISKPLCV